MSPQNRRRKEQIRCSDVFKAHCACKIPEIILGERGLETVSWVLHANTRGIGGRITNHLDITFRGPIELV